MSSIEKDKRFSRVLTDPRFLPMPAYQKKVKIDKRFNALFTSKDFGHKTHIDKRGRPVHDVSKRGKHVMEQFYQLSSEDSSSGDDDDSDDSDDESKEETANDEVKVSQDDSDNDPLSKKTNREKESLKTKTAEKKKSKKRVFIEEDEDEESIEEQSVTKKLKKGKQSDDNDEEDSDSDHEDDESSDSEESSDEEEDEVEYTTEHDLEETAVDHKWNELHRDAPIVSDSTYRLAVCNMDWDFVKAQDLFVLFNSFAGEGASVLSVAIYPSEFGKERMAEEAVLGPKEMRDNLSKNNTNDDKKNNSKNRKKRKMEQEKQLDGKIQKQMEKDVVKNSAEVLRNYQLNRMRYYYAVVECSSVEAADNIYKDCDGQEYQLSCVKLDLRFIPDDMTFEDTPKESFSADQGLVEYEPKMFNSSALSQAKVEVTWDETDFDRLQKKMKTVQHKELESIVEENRYADIIAPPESDSDSDEDGRPEWLKSVLGQDSDEEEEDISEEKKISLYRRLIMDKLEEEEEKESKDNEVDKEIEFVPGLKSAVESKLKKNEKAQGTVVDDYLQKKKEKRKKKRELKKAELTKGVDGVDDNDLDDDEIPDVIDDSLKEMMESEGLNIDSIKSKKKKKLNKNKKTKVEADGEDSEAEREKAELELLLMGDVSEKNVTKTEKTKKEGKLSRRQKKKQALKEREQKKQRKEEELKMDVNDDRFSAMFTSHHFHIDPSAPEFKNTENMMRLVDEQIKRKPSKAKKEISVRKDVINGNGEDEHADDSRAVSKKLVESLKRKMKKV